MSGRPTLYTSIGPDDNFSLDFIFSPPGDVPASATVARKLLSDSWLCASWAECVAFARRKFEKYFNHKAKQLLTHFPKGECKQASKKYIQGAHSGCDKPPNDIKTKVLF